MSWGVVTEKKTDDQHRQVLATTLIGGECKTKVTYNCAADMMRRKTWKSVRFLSGNRACSSPVPLALQMIAVAFRLKSFEDTNLHMTSVRA